MRKRLRTRGGHERICPPKPSGIARLTARTMAQSALTPGATLLQAEGWEILIFSIGIRLRQLRSQQAAARLKLRICWGMSGSERQRFLRRSLHLSRFHSTQAIRQI